MLRSALYGVRTPYGFMMPRSEWNWVCFLSMTLHPFQNKGSHSYEMGDLSPITP